MLELTQYYLSKSPKNITRDDIAKLSDVIDYHRKQYYDDAPVISDAEFDALYSLLVQSESLLGFVHAQSPTQRIQQLSDNHFRKAPHLHPMMSLDNTYDADDLIEFEKRIMRILEKDSSLVRPQIEYRVEYKFDGLGIALLYRE